MVQPNDTPKYGLGDTPNNPTDDGFPIPSDPAYQAGSTFAYDAPGDRYVEGEPSKTDQVKDEAANVAGNAQDRAKDVAGTAKDEAANVKDAAVSASSDVVESAKQQAGEVVAEARTQGRQLLDQGLTELRTQASNGQTKLAEIVRSLSTELDEMVGGSQQGGPATELAQTAHSLTTRAADWLESNGPDEVVTSVRRYAARNPWAFMAIAAGVGLVGSRVVRGLQGAKSDDESYRTYRAPVRHTETTFAVDDRPAYTQPLDAPVTSTGDFGGAAPQGGYDPLTGQNRDQRDPWNEGSR